MPARLVLVTEDWFFVSHFLPMAGAARQAGFDVTVATRVRKDGARLEAEGLRVISLEAERGASRRLNGIRDLARAIKILRAERPDVVQCIALRPVVIGGIVAKLGTGASLILVPTGLGHLWVEQGRAIRILRASGSGCAARTPTTCSRTATTHGNSGSIQTGPKSQLSAAPAWTRPASRCCHWRRRRR